jgi:aconitate hydratase 2/2-methylisocitrate dehydratase
MINEGYGDPRTLERRARAMEAWLAKPELMEADKDAEYAAVIEIDLADVKEPVVCCPNDPDDAKLLSEVAGNKVDEVFIGSCMTNIGHFRAAGKLLEAHKGSLNTTLWIAPPTKMDQHQLVEEGYYGIFGKAGARTEMPGCSLCMGNQARIKTGATALSTSTRNFPNRLGDNTDVYLTSAELAAVGAILGRLPTVAEYMEYANKLNSMSADIYRYMNFNEIASFQDAANEGKIKAVEIMEVRA